MQPGRLSAIRQHTLSGLLNAWPAMLGYAILSIGLSWPTIMHFQERFTGVGEDPLHNLWIYWHTLQVVLLRQSLFDAPLLYYPQGASLLTHGLGPVTGIFGLPFWPLGPTAAHNGVILVSLWLTGLSMYALARGLDLDRGVAFFAGVMLMASPMCLAGLYGTITKVFLGALPLVLLGSIHALDQQRTPLWAVGAGVALLMALLHSGYQFIYAVFGMAFFTAAAWIGVAADRRGELLRRTFWLGLSAAVFAGPLVLAIVLASADPALKIDANRGSSVIDVALLGQPSYFSALFGDIAGDARTFVGEASDIERAIGLSYSGLVLAGIGLWLRRSSARAWVLFTLVFALLALGPFLKFLGQTRFTEYELPLILPYAFVTGLPGLGFLRASGRFMMIGYVGFAMAAALGLSALVVRWPQRRTILVGLAIGLVLLENWPRPFPQQTLPRTPEFYRELAADPEQYGVFDLPIQPDPYPHTYVPASAAFQIFQMAHQKGIVAGYLSRTYARHPVFPGLIEYDLPGDQRFLLVNGLEVTAARKVRADLAVAGYRYVVWHKQLYRSGNPSAEAFLTAVFSDQVPLLDDEHTRVYRVEPDLPVEVEYGAGWWPAEDEWRWAGPEATIRIESAAARRAELVLVPAAVYEPQAPGLIGGAGSALVLLNGEEVGRLDLVVAQPAQLGLDLPVGRSALTLVLEAGSFRPAEQDGGADTRDLSFAVRSIELRVD
jgi:hypothetical protein